MDLEDSPKELLHNERVYQVVSDVFHSHILLERNDIGHLARHHYLCVCAATLGYVVAFTLHASIVFCQNVACGPMAVAEHVDHSVFAVASF